MDNSPQIPSNLHVEFRKGMLNNSPSENKLPTEQSQSMPADKLTAGTVEHKEVLIEGVEKDKIHVLESEKAALSVEASALPQTTVATESVISDTLPATETPSSVLLPTDLRGIEERYSNLWVANGERAQEVAPIEPQKE